MNCAEQLVDIFGSQADVARAFQLDRAVVHNWVKTGYVPARWAGEVERVTEGRISSNDVINEASAEEPGAREVAPGRRSIWICPREDPMSQYAPAKRIQSFHPPQRTLMGPGPTEIHPRVLTTMSQPAIGYLDPVFVEMMEELKSLLRYVYQTKNPLTFPLSGPGSVGMEYCFVNMVAPGDKVDRLPERRVRRPHARERRSAAAARRSLVEDKWGEPVDPQKVEDALKKNKRREGRRLRARARPPPARSRTRRRSTQIAHKHGALVIVDAVTSLAGTPVQVDEWEIDAIYSASQKCLSCTPGLSPVSFSERVVEHVKKRKDKIHSWFMDMNLLLGYWGATHAHLSPHRADQLALRAARGAAADPRGRPGERLGARHAPPPRAQGRPRGDGPRSSWSNEKYQLPQMNAVLLPGRRERGARCARRLLNEFSIEIGAGLGPLAGKIWRFGLMGYSLPPGQRDAVPVGARLGALRHGHAGARRRRRSRGARRVRADARQGRATQEASGLGWSTTIQVDAGIPAREGVRAATPITPPSELCAAVPAARARSPSARAS